MSVNEARAKFEAAKKDVERCQGSTTELQRKCDTLEESLPGLTRAVEEAGKAKVSALDAFALNSNKESESELRRARAGHELAQKTNNESNELVEATHRALKRQESELVRLNNVCELVKRQVWEAISESYESKITEEVREYIAIITTIGSQIGRSRQFILDCLFSNPTHDDVQEIQRNLRKEYGVE